MKTSPAADDRSVVGSTPLPTDRLTILTGDALKMLRTLPAESVQCCVTSPPYWGLRDYGVRGQIGQEKSLDQYLAKLVDVFGEVRRVLRSDGTCWVNMGDCYNVATSKGRRYSATNNKDHGYWSKAHGDARCNVATLKPKDLVGQPWLLAFALQRAGWWLRCDIIWHKPNPMPESVTDRPTRAHEYLFLLSKRERYFYDAEAIKEPASPNTHARIAQANFWNQTGGPKDYQNAGNANRSIRRAMENYARNNGVNPKAKTPGANSRIYQARDPKHSAARKNKQNESFSAAVVGLVLERNKRTVWTVATAPYKEAHFATFPPSLIKPCILAGSRPGDLVLDPFGGSGTTGAVALELGRRAILIELNPAYVKLAERRCAITPGLALA